MNKKRIVFMGTPPFAATVLKKLLENDDYNVVGVVTQPDKLVGRKKVLTPTPVKLVAVEHNIEVFQPTNIKEDYKAVIKMEPEIIITAAYGQILPKDLLEFPKYKCINVHASLLPAYRGGAPIHRAIINGEKKTGVSIMYMVEKMDAGDIISQAEIEISDADDTGTMFEKLANLGSDLLSQTLPSIFAKSINVTKQDEHLVTYAKNITRSEEKIDWQLTAKQIDHYIRGMTPFPTCYTVIDNLNIKVFKASIIDIEVSAKAGEIINISNDGIEVATSDNKVISLTEIQMAGKRKMPLKDILNGNHPFKIGKILA